MAKVIHPKLVTINSQNATKLQKELLANAYQSAFQAEAAQRTLVNEEIRKLRQMEKALFAAAQTIAEFGQPHFTFGADEAK